MSNEKNEELEDLEKRYRSIDQACEKTIEIIGSIGMATAVSSLLAAFLGPENSIGTIMTMTGGTILLSPAVYFGLKKIKDKFEEHTQRDMHHTSQLGIMLREVHEKDRRIGSMTALFLNEILDVFETENQNFPQEQIMNINQFIYLINSNYYEEIQKSFKEMSRDVLVRKIVEQISIYLNDSKREIFDETDAQKSLSYCLFIPENLKKEIAQEFKQSKVTVFGTTTYEIIRNDITGEMNKYIGKKQEETHDLYSGFDIDDGTDYYELILSYIQDPYYIENGYKDPRDIDWDIGFLKKAIKTIVRDHREELLDTNEYYSNYNLTSSLVSNALMYALVNNRKQVGQQEIINTFKNWDYLPFNMKLSVLDTLFTEEAIDFSSHPFGVSKKKVERPKQKIIEFRPKQIESE